MEHTQTARFLGAGLAAATVTTAVFSDWQQCGGNGLRGWILLFLPVAVAIVFSLPRPDFGSYVCNGVGALLGISLTAGVYGSGVEPPTSCELLYAGFTGYLIVWAIFASVALTVGSLPFGLILLLGRRFGRLAS